MQNSKGNVTYRISNIAFRILHLFAAHIRRKQKNFTENLRLRKEFVNLWYLSVVNYFYGNQSLEILF
jgi:hypothetical protein